MSNRFQNRTGSNLNRKKLTIISQTANEMIVDVERADTVEQQNQGTVISATVMNDFEDRMSSAETNSSTALSNANSALSASSSADTKATTALSNSQQALSTANSAQQAVQTLASQVSDRGAVVKFNNVSQTEVNFSSDPQIQIDNKLNKDFSLFTEKSTLADNDILIVQDYSSAEVPKEIKKTAFSSLKSQLINAIYPINSIYISTSATSPASIFGGTWTQIKDRFLLGAGDSYSGGMTGGETLHVLTTNEMPSHRHRILTYTGHTRQGIGNCYSPCSTSGDLGAYWGIVGTGATNSVNNGNTSQQTSTAYSSGYSDCAKNGSVNTNTKPIIENSGIGAAHNNMPPYLTVYMWKRVG